MITAIRSLSFTAAVAAMAIAAAPAGAAVDPANSFNRSAELAAAPTNHIGMHSMLYTDTPYSAKEEMFKQARAVGASYIRVDIALSGIFLRGTFNGHPIESARWTRTDEYATLSNKYGVKVIAMLYSTPWFVAECPPNPPSSDRLRCPAGDLVRYQQMIHDVAVRYAGVINDFEIINEPDTSRAFYGTPQQYADMLVAAADGIHSANSDARVAIGGISTISNTVFTDAVLAARPSLTSKVDVNTIHLRSTSSTTAMNVSLWRQYYDDHGMNGPLWLTEYGYPSATAFQYDPRFRNGEAAQASFLSATLPGVLGAGGDLIFITQRDWGSGHFASEGILDTDDPLPENPTVRRKAAFAVVKQASQSLTPAPLEPPPGTTRLTTTTPERVKMVGGRITVHFSCIAAGDCKARAFKLKFLTGEALRVVAPEISAGKNADVRVKLTRPSMRRVARARYKGVKATLADYRRSQVQAITITR